MLRESNTLYNFFLILGQIRDWIGNVIYSLGQALFYSNDYFRYCFYLVFFMVLAEFSFDIIVSFIYSFKTRQLFLFRPFSLKDKSVIFQGLRNNNSFSGVKNKSINYNAYDLKSFSVLNRTALDARNFVPVNRAVADARNFVPVNRAVVDARRFSSYDLRHLSLPDIRLFSLLQVKSFAVPYSINYVQHQLRNYFPLTKSVTSNFSYVPNLNLRSSEPKQFRFYPLSYFKAYFDVHRNRLYYLNLYNSRLSDRSFIFKYKTFSSYLRFSVKDTYEKYRGANYVNAGSRKFNANQFDLKYRKAIKNQREHFKNTWSNAHFRKK